jgi:esterase
VSKIHYQIYPLEEKKPWVLLIHGLFGSLDNLSGLRRGLTNDYNVLAIDLPDHGKSMRTTKFSFDENALLIIELIKRLKLEKISIIGHSLGGKIAMQIALNAPGMVECLVIMDIAPVAYLPRHDAVFSGLQSVPLDKITSRQDADSFLKQSLEEASTRQFLLKSLYQDENGWHWYFNLPLLKRDYAEIIQEIYADVPYYGPTLFIKGELSDYLLPQHREKILALFPNSQSKLIGGTGHWLHAEKPAICLKTINLFFKKTMPP